MSGKNTNNTKKNTVTRRSNAGEVLVLSPRENTNEKNERPSSTVKGRRKIISNMTKGGAVSDVDIGEKIEILEKRLI